MLKFAFFEFFYHKRWKKDSRLLFNRLLIVFFANTKDETKKRLEQMKF